MQSHLETASAAVCKPMLQAAALLSSLHPLNLREGEIAVTVAKESVGDYWSRVRMQGCWRS